MKCHDVAGAWRALALAAALAIPAVAAAQAVPPSTPVGRETAFYLDALNTGDPAKAAVFIAEHFPTSPMAAEPFAAFQNQVGGFELVKVEAASPTALTAVVRERYGDSFAQLKVTVDPAPPHRILTLERRPTPRPAEIAAPVRLDDAALALAVEAQLALMGDDFFGAVLVTRRGKTIVSAVQGLADRERQLPNTLETRFRVGSMDKMFTGVAILQLVQAGKLDLQAPLATYLKDYPNAAFARQVTLHQLLTHTGGAGDIFGDEYDAKRDQLRTLRDYVALYGARAPDFPPGSDWDYSNYGYILLGRVVEVVSGQSYYDYVQARIFAPAGMTGTGFEPESVVVPGRAVAYEKGATDYTLAGDLPWRGTSAGGGYATVGDFARFVAALYDGRLMDAEHRAMMTLGRVDGGGMTSGYGFAIYPGAQPPMIGHNGIAPGMNGDLRIIGDGEGAIVVLSNVSPPRLAGVLGKFITGRFGGP